MASDERWSVLGQAHSRPLPKVLLDALELKQGSWLDLGRLATEYTRMPELDGMMQGMTAFASLGRCSVGVALYMAGAIDQLQHGEAAAKIEREGNFFRVHGRLQAGFFFLLNDTYVVPHEFHCWWRLEYVRPSPGHELHTVMPPVQNLDVDGCALLGQAELLSAKRPWLPHQQRSFRWMSHREAVRDLFVCESSISKPTGLDDLELRWKMDKAFDLRGGVLCDPVGSGKTATVLGLVQHDSCAIEWDYEGADAARTVFSDSWLTLNATLVLCPDHVHEQWVKEVDKFMPEGALEVTSICTVSELRSTAPLLRTLSSDAACAIEKPRLVVAALGILADPEYQELISPSNSDIKGWLQGQEQWEQGLALDCFVWRRLVIDEVHEAVHVCDASKCLPPCPRASLMKNLRGLKSERRWGLTGTAQEILRDPASVQRLAQVFRTDFNSEASSRRFIEHHCRTNQVELAVRVQERTEIIELSPIESMIYKQQERDLLALGIDGTGAEPLSPDALISLVPLLKLCSHFLLVDHFQKFDSQLPGVITPNEVAKNMYESRKLQLDLATGKLTECSEAEAEIMGKEDTKPTALEVAIPAAAVSGLWAEPQWREGEPVVVVTRVEAQLAEACQKSSESRPGPYLQVGDTLVALNCQPAHSFAKQLWQLRQEVEAAQIAEGPAADALQAEFKDLELRQNLAEALRRELLDKRLGASVSLSWRQTGLAEAHMAVVGRSEECRRNLVSLHTRWQQADASFRFMSRLWNSLMAEGELNQECPICFETFDAAACGVLLRCAHMYCEQCSKRMFTGAGSAVQRAYMRACPLCRSTVNPETDVVSLTEFAKARATVRSVEDAAMSKDLRHGSKLQYIAKVLRDIASSDSDDRAIVFCQFADLELQISQALADHGIIHARLSSASNIFERTAILDSFQTRKGSNRVLLLSLEQSASGTNLTAANHVLFVHPMAASTPERAVAFEQQAVGRCVRMGQTRPVTVWRFVTRNTVEETLASRLAEWHRSPAVHDARVAGSGSKAAKALSGSSSSSRLAAKAKGSPRPPRNSAARSPSPGGLRSSAARSLSSGSSRQPASSRESRRRSSLG